MPSIEIDVRGSVARVAAGMEDRVSSRRINAPVGEAVTRLFARHLAALPANKAGFTTTRFWQRAAQATNWQLIAEGVIVSINQQGVRQRYQGGDIKPVRKTYLAIPACDEAYGHAPGEFTLKFAIVADRGFHRPALVSVRTLSETAAHSRTKRGKKEQGEQQGPVLLVMYWLVKHVHQEPNPNVIPSREQISATVMATVRSVWSRN